MTGFPTGDVWACEWRRYTSVDVTGHEHPIWLPIPFAPRRAERRLGRHGTKLLTGPRREVGFRLTVLITRAH